MVLSKREKIVFVGTLVAVGLLTLDRVVVSPLFDQLDQAHNKRDSLTADLNVAQDLIANRRQAAARWQEMVRTGMKNDPAEAESQILHAIGNWAEESGVALSLKIDRLTEKTRLPEIMFQANGTGTMNGIAHLLWRAQTADIPVKILEVQINTRKEGVDDLSVQFRISTVYSPGQGSPATTTSTPSGASGGRK